MSIDPFEVLGIEPDASLREAATAYRRLVALYHPDRLQDLPPDVIAEGSRRLREATAAMRVIRARHHRPLVASGRERPRPAAAMPVPSAGPAPRVGSVAPSDAATAAEGRLYDVELMESDRHGLHLRWGGRHAAAVLAALRHAHRVDGGPIRQVEWGTYEALLEGDATRRLLDAVLPDDDEWLDQEVVIVHSGDNEHRLPARKDATGHLVIDLRTTLDLIDDRTWYTLLADVY